MFNFKKLLISILVPNLFGILGNILGNSSMSFANVIKPSFAPPAIVFPVVWIILYSLMGVSSYLIYASNSSSKNKALKTYLIQLIINSLWPFFFFNLEWYLFAFIWLLLLLYFVLKMVFEFYQINKMSAHLQILYILWLIFAGILNFYIYVLNR